MYPIIFSVGEVNIYSHGVMVAIGALTGGYLIYYLAKKENLETAHLFELLVYSLFIGIIGARLTYVVLYYNQYSTFREIFYIWYGGLVSFGGVISGFLAAYIMLKKWHENILKWFDLGIIGLLVGWAFGRIGCMLSGDILGVATSSKIAINGLVPIALIESIWSLILAAVLFYLITYQKNLVSRFNDGFIFTLGIVGFCLGRFIIDFFRSEDILFWHIKTGQFVSILILLGVIIFFFLKIKKKQNGGVNV